MNTNIQLSIISGMLSIIISLFILLIQNSFNNNDKHIKINLNIILIEFITGFMTYFIMFNITNTFF